VQHSTVQLSTAQHRKYSTVHYSAVQYSTDSTAQHNSTVRHSTLQCSTVQYSSVLDSTVLYISSVHCPPFPPILSLISLQFSSIFPSNPLYFPSILTYFSIQGGMGEFLTMVSDSDLEVRKACLLMINAATHHFPHIMTPFLRVQVRTKQFPFLFNFFF
jgi:hypothetical protein